MLKNLCLILFLVSFTLQLWAQVCTGNLGENIFIEGDFGAGTPNIPPNDPQIAPGYIYTTAPPPIDGDYTITNNTGAWPDLFGTWLPMGDNSSDPNGYMMVVNASYQPGLFYSQEIQGLCDGILYEFSADIINILQSWTADHIEPNISFLLDGIVFFSTGDIPQDEAWHTYGFTFTMPQGQTSLTLSLRNNAPGGLGNDLAIDNISFRPCGPEALIHPPTIGNVCENGTPVTLEAFLDGNQYSTPNYQWQESFDGGQTWADIAGANNNTFTHTNPSAGFYYYRYLLANSASNLLNSKCRILSEIKIIEVRPIFFSVVETLCDGQAFSLGNNLYSTAGIYTDSLIAYSGCDSIVTLDLTISPNDLDVNYTIGPISCSNSQDGRISVDTVLNGNPPYSITINDVPSPFGSLDNLAEGNYPLIISDDSGCVLEETVVLQSPSPFAIDLGPDLEITLGDAFEISPAFTHLIEQYAWQSSDLMACTMDCTSQSWVPPNSLSLYLTATSTKGCVASDSVYIEVLKNRDVFCPNAFTPNLDGINDYFTLFGEPSKIKQIDRLIIFDRWGEAVFKNTAFYPNDLKTGWDGTFRGENMPIGVYTYYAEVRFIDDEIVVCAGDLTLIR